MTAFWVQAVNLTGKNDLFKGEEQLSFAKNKKPSAKKQKTLSHLDQIAGAVVMSETH